MEFTISPEMIGGLGDLGYGLIGGASFDFDGTEYVIEDFDNLSEQLKAEAADRKAREFLQAYCMARGIPIPNIDPELPALTTKEFYKSQYFDSANRTVWNNYKLGRTTLEQQEALRFPINPQAFNDWTGYSEFWYQKYMEQFYIEEEEEPEFEIPVGYQAYIDNILAYNYRIANANQLSGIIQFTDPLSDSSYVALSGLENYSSDGALYLWNCNKITFEVTSLNNNYSFSYSPVYNNHFYSTSNPNWDTSRAYIYFPAQEGSNWRFGENYTSKVQTYSYSGSLSGLLDYLTQHFVNFDLVIDGNTWIGGIDQAPSNPIIPDFNDVIGGNEEDPIPAYDIVFPDTSDNEGTFDITSLFDALKEAIIGASDNDDTTDSSLTREKVTDTYKDRVGDAVGVAVKTIDDVMEDSFPVQGTLNYPNLPPIPQIPLDNAFAGTTILSELIDACQKIIPSPLALAFWGMIFILFIIGLIRILHK